MKSGTTVMATMLLANADGEAASAVLFYVFAGIAGASALGVVVSRNIVRMAVWLLFALVGVAGLYFLLQSEFLAAAQLVIYVGGTLILILFGVMLTSKSPFAHFEPKRGEVVIAVVLAVVLLASLVAAVRGSTFGSAPAEPGRRYSIVALGQALLGDYLVPFELASVLLLVVMIGAAYLAKARRREDDGPPVVRGAAAVSDLTTKARRWS